MYFIRKYSNGWAIHDDDTGSSRLLTKVEREEAARKFPELSDGKVVTVFFDHYGSRELMGCVGWWNLAVKKQPG